MKTRLFFIIILLIGCNTTLFGNTINDTIYKKIDSLILKKNNSEKKVIITSGKKIKVWKGKNEIVRGKFESLNKNIVTIINQKKVKIQISTDKITKIKMIGSTTRQIASGTMTGIGVTGVALGTVFMGVAANEETGLGSSLSGAIAGVVGGTGIIFLSGGRLLSGRKFNLKKKWSIQTDL